MGLLLQLIEPEFKANMAWMLDRAFWQEVVALLQRVFGARDETGILTTHGRGRLLQLVPLLPLGPPY